VPDERRWVVHLERVVDALANDPTGPSPEPPRRDYGFSAMVRIARREGRDGGLDPAA
jgi:hypothetical protein